MQFDFVERIVLEVKQRTLQEALRNPLDNKALTVPDLFAIHHPCLHAFQAVFKALRGFSPLKIERNLDLLNRTRARHEKNAGDSHRGNQFFESHSLVIDHPRSGLTWCIWRFEPVKKDDAISTCPSQRFIPGPSSLRKLNLPGVNLDDVSQAPDTILCHHCVVPGDIRSGISFPARAGERPDAH